MPNPSPLTLANPMSTSILRLSHHIPNMRMLEVAYAG